MWQKKIMSSCNKSFKQVLSFLSNMISALFILWITLSSQLSVIRSKVSELVEPVVRKCSVNMVFLENSQNSLENTCVRDYF